MRKKTSNNLKKTTALIQKKGYDEQEARIIASRIFDDMESMHEKISIENLMDQMPKKDVFDLSSSLLPGFYLLDKSKDPQSKITVIHIRRGKIGSSFPYAAYNSDGEFICNLVHLRDARKRWDREIREGTVRLKRELNRDERLP